MPTTELRLITSRRERRSQLAARLAGLSECLQAARTPHAVVDLLVDEVARACGARYAGLHVVAGGKAPLSRARDLRDQPEALPSFDCAPALLAVCRAGRARWYRNRAALLAALPSCKAMDPQVTSVVALPLPDGDRLLGAFAVAYDEHHLLADDDLEFLLLTISLAARALARTWQFMLPVARDQAAICFFAVSENERRIRPRIRGWLDLGRLVRLVARRELAASPAGPPLTCAADQPIRGRWDRAWLEQTVSGLVGLVRRIGPGPIHLQVWSDGDGAFIDVVGGAAPPTRRSDRIDLAAMTSACEEWTLGRWLWQGLARQQGAHLAVVQDENAPRGVRLRLPASGFSLPS